MSNITTLDTFPGNAYTLADSYGSEQGNIEVTPDDDLELLEIIIKHNEYSDIISNLREMEKGINIRGTWYDYEEISHVLEGKTNEKNKVC